MTRNEIIDVLSVAAAFDQRTGGETDIIAWSTALRDVEFPTARDAVIAHYREETRRVMPADIIRYRNHPGERPHPLPFKTLCRRCAQPGHAKEDCPL
jgi:hypothetical protein